VRSVLITGASTGIGRATALRLDADGWRVFAGVRREEDAEALRAAGSERLLPLIIDVLDPEQIAAAAARIEADSPAGLDGLVNNAGVAIPGPLETIPIDDFRRQVEVNLTAQVAVTQALLPAIREARGRVVFIASIGGRIAFPLNGPYHAAKFGIEAVGDVFRQELRPWGISVSIVEPGTIDTPIWERGERNAQEVEARAPAHQEELYGAAIARFREVVEKLAAKGIPPEKVAAAIAHALESGRPRTRYLVGLDAKQMRLD
jgi:NAD(P)-dependent dehydrogenase (short-subunit alcohol dehydrogenase family)